MKLKYVIASVIVMYVVNGCTTCCTGLEFEDIDLSYCSVSVANLDNRGATPVVSADNRIPRRAFGLELSLAKTEDVCWHLPRNPFLSSALAYDCDDDYVTVVRPVDTIRSIEVFTVQAYSDAIPAGTEVSELFRVLSFDQKLFPIDSFLSGPIFANANFYVSYNGEPQVEQLRLVVATPPSVRDQHQFTVRMRLSDGREFSATSPSVTLL